MSNIIEITEYPAQIKIDSEHTQEPDPTAPPPVSTTFQSQLIPPLRGGGALDNPTDPLLQFLRLDAGQTLVNQAARMVFNYPGDESLRAIIDCYLLDITWVLVFAHHNFLDTPVEEIVRVQTSRTISTGAETNRELNIGAAYNGLSIGFGNSVRTFSREETVSSETRDTTYRIPPNSSLYVYQRRYRFHDEIWWIANAWANLWNVCKPPSGYELLRVPFDSLINADERMAINRPLTGTARALVTWASQAYVPNRQINRQFFNHTPRTKWAVQRVMNDANRRDNRDADANDENENE